MNMMGTIIVVGLGAVMLAIVLAVISPLLSGDAWTRRDRFVDADADGEPDETAEQKHRALEG